MKLGSYMILGSYLILWSYIRFWSYMILGSYMVPWSYMMPRSYMDAPFFFFLKRTGVGVLLFRAAPGSARGRTLAGTCVRFMEPHAGRSRAGFFPLRWI